ncbi:PAS domain-containing protein [Mucilaginibacter polytrichastri]|uniref:histidine kinase n=1 Tax=Mucilaginibacter polytrichastri TaxID=1302689 RepID=A0A1Q6A6P1_9SPHI|nr:PAS domain-containing protein [Mucilaginibacter polytrichastri]OKS89688.1 hypothetical protein RG47T_5173 [Mucilaginibacter polytrichastri]SFT25058.1 PAS domain S-box-containing protein [Mucilaginibacter polytrichastri]
MIPGMQVKERQITEAAKETIREAYELSNQQKRIYETVISNTPDLMYVFGLDYRFTYANTALLSMWGKSYENAVGKSLLENGYEPWHAEMHEREIDQVKMTKQPIRGEVSFPHATLGRRVYDYILTPVFNEQGEVEAVAGTTRDVTERKHWEESLARTSEELQAINEELATVNEELAAVNEEQASSNEELTLTNDKLNETRQELEEAVKSIERSQSRFQNLVREANIGIIVLMGEEMRVEIVNKTYGNLIGRSVEELLGHNLFEIIPEAERDFRPIIEDVRLKAETRYLFDVPYHVYNNGEKLEGYLNLVYQPYHENDQSVTGVIIICQEVTEQVQAKINLQSAYEQLRLSKEAAQLGFFDMDLNRGTMEWDARCRELFGISHNDTVTYEKDFVTGLHPDDKDRILAIIDKVFIKSVSNGIYDVEYRTVGVEDQQIRWVRAKGQAYFDQNDEPVRFVGSVLDITEQKEDELRKNDFIGMVSHELKTPLTSLKAIIQMANLKLKNTDDAFLAGAMEKANVQVKRMTNMINGFLNVSRLESAKLQIDKHKFDLAEMIEETVKEINLTITSHAIEFERINTVFVNADRDKIISVATNLISNAIKYSPKGKVVEVKCEVIGDNVQVSVKDEGMGLKPQDVSKVFDRYFRVESNHTRHIAGFGIGLYLSAEIIHRHDGKIWVESESDNGSTFYFSLPI